MKLNENKKASRTLLSNRTKHTPLKSFGAKRVVLTTIRSDEKFLPIRLSPTIIVTLRSKALADTDRLSTARLDDLAMLTDMTAGLPV